MEVDSIHAPVEKRLKKKVIHVPAGYIEMLESCRPICEYDPYSVKYLSHDYFRDYHSLEKYKNIRPGSKSGDPVVTDIVALRFENDSISYKLSFSDEYSPLPASCIKRTARDDPTELTTLHPTCLPIKKSKWQHVQDLKPYIPKNYHSFYHELPYRQ